MLVRQTIQLLEEFDGGTSMTAAVNVAAFDQAFGVMLVELHPGNAWQLLGLLDIPFVSLLPILTQQISRNVEHLDGLVHTGHLQTSRINQSITIIAQTVQ